LKGALQRRKGTYNPTNLTGRKSKKGVMRREGNGHGKEISKRSSGERRETPILPRGRRCLASKPSMMTRIEGNNPRRTKTRITQISPKRKGENPKTYFLGRGGRSGSALSNGPVTMESNELMSAKTE